MNIVYKTLEEIFPYANNPRKNDDAVEAVAKSIQEFGFKVPIVIDKNGVIVTGHTRYKAAMRIGMTEVPCIIADDLTEDQVKAFRLVDNKVAELSGWDFHLLENEILEIPDFDFGLFGFEEIGNNNIDGLFEIAEEKEKEPKKIQCPHCGEWFEP